MPGRIARYYHTLRYLKPEQIGYRLYYGLRSRARMRPKYKVSERRTAARLNLEPSLVHDDSYASGRFTFLNVSREFPGKVDWTFAGHGRLWTYNLNYFNYLQQEDMSTHTGLELIRHFMRNVGTHDSGLEPYPTSVRCINWIKFLSLRKIDKAHIAASLSAQYDILLRRLEYHLLGNHLLENGFALLFGAYYFNDAALYKKARVILRDELAEQVLADGGHFERSPMYHQLMLYRILDSINLVKHNPAFNQELLPLLKEKASSMLGWLNQMTFANGDIPLFNDAARGIAPDTRSLETYARRLGVEAGQQSPGESGYRRYVRPRYEAIVDVGDIGPDYLPGHAHSDTFNFELHVDGRPFMVDSGTSTYENNEVRAFERSTAAHNTVRVAGKDQSEVWSRFRVARRAYIRDLVEDAERISARHTGYERIGCRHTRRFDFQVDRIVIADTVVSRQTRECQSFLHFSPGSKVSVKDHTIAVNGKRIAVQNADFVAVEDYDHAPEFNKRVPAQVAVITFKNHLRTEIML